MNKTSSVSMVVCFALVAACGDGGSDPAAGDGGGSAEATGGVGSGGSSNSSVSGSATSGSAGDGGSDGTDDGESGGLQTSSGESDDGSAEGGHDCADPTPLLEAPPCMGGPATENEPNEVAAQATPYCIGESVQGTLSDPEDIDMFEFEVPPAQYGGYIIVRAENTDPGARLDLEVRSGEDNGVIGGQYGGNVGEDRVVHLAAAPGQTFRALVQENAWGGLGDYSVRVDWFPAFDCYEPNDHEGQARQIPVGRPIHAKLFAGYFDSGAPGKLDTADWYRVDLEAGAVQIHGTQSPTDVQLSITLYDELGNQVAWTGADGDGAPVSVEADVGPGAHLIQVAEDWTPATAVGQGTQAPPHFTDDYQLLVEQ